MITIQVPFYFLPICYKATVYNIYELYHSLSSTGVYTGLL